MAPGIWTTHQGMLTFLEELKNSTKRGIEKMGFCVCLKSISKSQVLIVAISKYQYQQFINIFAVSFTQLLLNWNLPSKSSKESTLHHWTDNHQSKKQEKTCRRRLLLGTMCLLTRPLAVQSFTRMHWTYLLLWHFNIKP